MHHPELRARVPKNRKTRPSYNNNNNNNNNNYNNNINKNCIARSSNHEPLRLHGPSCSRIHAWAGSSCLRLPRILTEGPFSSERCAHLGPCGENAPDLGRGKGGEGAFQSRVLCFYYTDSGKLTPKTVHSTQSEFGKFEESRLRTSGSSSYPLQLMGQSPLHRIYHRTELRGFGASSPWLGSWNLKPLRSSVDSKTSPIKPPWSSSKTPNYPCHTFHLHGKAFHHDELRIRGTGLVVATSLSV